MKVIAVKFENYRNLKNDIIQPCDGVNIIYGDNAQGKTNLLEALWMFTGARSFRGARDAECVAFGAQKAQLSLDFESGGRAQEATVTVSKRRSVTLNGIAKPSAAALAGVQYCGSPTIGQPMDRQ